MRAVDTNILVRFFTLDDESQTARAIAALRREQVWVPKTVLLEMEWVFRSVYKFSPERILEAVRGLGGMDNVHFEDPSSIARAVDLFEGGLEFADALHVASAGESSQFVTFDQKFVRRAKHRTRVEVVPL